MDKDILTLVFTLIAILVFLLINKKMKWKAGVRGWIGIILIIVGIFGLFNYGTFTFSEEQIAGLILLIGGFCLWLIKPKKLLSN